MLGAGTRREVLLTAGELRGAELQTNSEHDAFEQIAGAGMRGGVGNAGEITGEFDVLEGVSAASRLKSWNTNPNCRACKRGRSRTAGYSCSVSAAQRCPGRDSNPDVP